MKQNQAMLVLILLISSCSFSKIESKYKVLDILKAEVADMSSINLEENFGIQDPSKIKIITLLIRLSGNTDEFAEVACSDFALSYDLGWSSKEAPCIAAGVKNYLTPASQEGKGTKHYVKKGSSPVEMLFAFALPKEVNEGSLLHKQPNGKFVAVKGFKVSN